jgi:hypothetical protein
VNVDGIVQEIRRSRDTGPRDLLPATELLDEILVELGGSASGGRPALLERVRSHPAFAGKEIPVPSGPVPAPAPAGATS